MVDKPESQPVSIDPLLARIEAMENEIERLNRKGYDVLEKGGRLSDLRRIQNRLAAAHKKLSELLKSAEPTPEQRSELEADRAQHEAQLEREAEPGGRHAPPEPPEPQHSHSSTCEPCANCGGVENDGTCKRHKPECNVVTPPPKPPPKPADLPTPEPKKEVAKKRGVFDWPEGW